MKRVLKRRTKKSLYLLVVILVLVSTFISPSAVMAWTRTITPIENEYGRNSKFRFSLSSSGEFTYVQHMDNYAFEIRDMANGVMYQTGWITSSSFNPINIMDNLKYDTGLYKFVGFGKSGTTIMDEDYIYYDYVSPWDKLEAPINLRWDGKIARWDANDTRATEYRIYLLDAKDNIITTKNSTTTSYNFAGYNPADGYWFEVAAVSASTSPRYRSSEINESPKYGTFTRTITPIENEYGRNSKFSFSLSSSGEFTYVQHMDNYAFEIRDMANGVMYQTGWITSSSFNPINIMDNLKYDTGLYKFVGFGKSGTTIMDEDFIYYDYVSPWDRLEAPINLRWDGKTARWDANDTRATEYRIYLLDSKDNIITTKNSTTTSYNFAGYNPADGYWFEVAAVSASTSPRYRSSEINESPKYEPTPLTTLNVLVTPAPAAGLTIGDLTVASSNSSKYTVVPGSVCWRLNDSGDCLSNSTTIEAGKTYTLRLTYSSEDGYTIPDDATFNVNGQATEWSGFEAKVNRKINFVIPEDNTRTISVKCYNLYTNEVDSGGDVYLRTDKGGGSWKTKDTRKATLNTNVEINALADDNYEFVEWRKNSPTGQVFKTNSYSTFTATEDVDLYAIFRKKVQRVSYTTHVQSYGWQPYVSNGEMAGTSGEAKRLEAIKIKLENQEYTGNIEYRTHIQSYGWEKSYKKNDEMSGTSGEAKRLEAIQIRLTGEIASYYDVYYRVHAQSFGWLGWARNDEEAGTEGYAKRLEGIEIKLVPKGSIVPGYGTEEAFKYKLVLYTTHVQSYGWQDYAADGEMSGTSGKAKRLEAIKIKLNNQKYTGDIEYMTHIQSYGWEKTWKKNDEMSGTSGEAKRLEAIKIRLTGAMASNYDIYYRVHAQSFGWLNWAKNGEESGTAGYAKRLEGIEIVLVEKGEAPPERSNQNDERAYIQK